jgi:hypothetical protein
VPRVTLEVAGPTERRLPPQGSEEAVHATTEVEDNLAPPDTWSPRPGDEDSFVKDHKGFWWPLKPIQASTSYVEYGCFSKLSAWLLNLPPQEAKRFAFFAETAASLGRHIFTHDPLVESIGAQSTPHYRTGAAGGRLQAKKPAIRHLTHAARTVTIAGLYAELDAAKAWPTILLAMARRWNLPHHTLAEMVDQEGVMTWLEWYRARGHSNIDAAALKAEISRYSMGGGINITPVHPKLRCLRAEIVTITDMAKTYLDPQWLAADQAPPKISQG